MQRLNLSHCHWPLFILLAGTCLAAGPANKSTADEYLRQTVRTAMAGEAGLASIDTYTAARVRELARMGAPAVAAIEAECEFPDEPDAAAGRRIAAGVRLLGRVDGSEATRLMSLWFLKSAEGYDRASKALIASEPRHPLDRKLVEALGAASDIQMALRSALRARFDGDVALSFADRIDAYEASVQLKVLDYLLMPGILASPAPVIARLRAKAEQARNAGPAPEWTTHLETLAPLNPTSAPDLKPLQLPNFPAVPRPASVRDK